MRMLLAAMAATAPLLYGPTASAVIASPALAGDRPDLEHVPRSCKRLFAAKENCRLDGCNVKAIEEWRERCKRDSTAHG